MGSCMNRTWCDPLTANRYMLRRGSAWTGSRWASLGMPGWKKGALFVERMAERSTVRLRQLACNRAEEVKLGRFLHNDRVSLEALNRGPASGLDGWPKAVVMSWRSRTPQS